MSAVDHRSVVFFLVPEFSMIAFTTAIEPLRLANRMMGRDFYSWRLASMDGAPVVASNGVTVNAVSSLERERHNLATSSRPSMMFLCSGVFVERYENKSLYAFLRESRNSGVTVGGLCTAAYLLAAAGLLNGKRCAIHWENLPGFTERFPTADVYADLYEKDGNIWTCAGGTAALDMMLSLIGEDHDEELVNRVCEQALTDRVRNPHDRQRLPLRARLGVQNAKVLSIIEFMEANIAEPLPLVDIARLCRPVAPPDRAPVPGPHGPLAGALLPRSPARPRAAPADAIDHSGGRRGDRLRLRLGLALFQVLPRDVRQVAAAGTRLSAVHCHSSSRIRRSQIFSPARQSASPAWA